MKTQIERKLKRKTNQELVETIISAKKNSAWLEVANLVSRPRRKQISFNLDEIDAQSSDGEVIVIPGKVLGRGSLNKKIKIVAFSFSESAIEKLKKSKIETGNIEEEIKKNKEAKKIKVLK